MSLIVSLILTYFSFKFFLWLCNFNKDEEYKLIQNYNEKTDIEPLILPPDQKINLSLNNINNFNDTNFKNLLKKETKIRRKHISVCVNYT